MTIELRNKEFNQSYYSLDITRVLEARRILRAECVARIGRILQTLEVLVGSHARNKPLVRPMGVKRLSSPITGLEDSSRLRLPYFKTLGT
jgi:hypothetical protein